MRIVKVLLLTLIMLLGNPSMGIAKSSVVGGPYENLALTGQIVNLKLTGYQTGAGFYIQQCKQVSGDSRPQVCNALSQLWISSSLGADYVPSADIQFKPSAIFTYGTQTINCVNTSCGIFIRLDHKASADRSEDQFLPITFVGSTVQKENSDVIRAFVNNRLISSSQSINVQNQSIFRIETTTKSGAIATYKSLTASCSVNGNQVTVLQGSGYCEIEITSPGNPQYIAISKIYRFRLVPAVPSLNISTRVQPGTTINLPITTSFGAKITYVLSSTRNCSLANNQNTYLLSFNKVGACTLKATAPASGDTYSALKQTISFKIR